MKKIILGVTLLSSIFILTACNKKKEVSIMQENIENEIVEVVQNEVETVEEETIVNEVVENKIENTIKPVTKKKTTTKTPVKKEEPKKSVEIEQPKTVVEELRKEEKKVYTDEELHGMILKDEEFKKDSYHTAGVQRNQIYMRYLKEYRAKYNK